MSDNKTTPSEPSTTEPGAPASQELVPAGTMVGTHAEDPPETLFVYSRNPQEMAVAQSQLVSWADRKLSEAREEYQDLHQNHQIAVKNKWRSDVLRRHATRALGRVEFYEKIKAALEEGYCIVPNFPGQVFAVRTTVARPARTQETVRRSWVGAGPGRNVAEVDSNHPALGDGRYVSRSADYTTQSVVTEHKPGKDPEYGLQFMREGFTAVEFPFALARPAIMDATSRAMLLKIFDEMVAVDNQPLEERRPKRAAAGDPMVVGRIFTRARENNKRQTVSFLVAWFVDTRTL